MTFKKTKTQIPLKAMKNHKLGALFIALGNALFIIGSFCAYRSPQILFNDISCILLNFDVKKKKSTTIVPLRQVNATELSHENTSVGCICSFG